MNKEDIMKPKPMFDCVTDLQELKKLSDMDIERHAERQRLREEAKANGVTDYAGLSSFEIKVIKELEGGKKLSFDALTQIDIPVSSLIQVLTVLEIKHRIVQLPGGYYAINEDY